MQSPEIRELSPVCTEIN